MAIFGKIGEELGGAFEGMASKAFETVTGGMNLADIGSAISGALKGDFSGLMDLGVNALATKFLGPTFGPMAADVALGLMRGEGLNTSVFTGVLEESGILPGTETFGAAMNVFSGIANGDFSVEEATELLAGLGVGSDQMRDLVARIASGEIDVQSLILTGGFGGGPGAGGDLTRS